MTAFNAGVEAVTHQGRAKKTTRKMPCGPRMLCCAMTFVLDWLLCCSGMRFL